MAMIDIPTEDRLAMARRHVEDGEGYVARQEALIAELERNEHAKLAVEARALLCAKWDYQSPVRETGLNRVGS